MRWIGLFLSLLSAHLFGQNLDSKYPDLIEGSHYSQRNPKFEVLYGGIGHRYPVAVNPEKLLGNNDDWFVSLPQGSYVIFKYTDNAIKNAPNQDDIIIIENGCCRLYHNRKNPERAKVYVSADGKTYVYLGTVDDCNTHTLDLEDIGFNALVRYIKIEGLDYKCNPAGFDLVNAYALPAAHVDLYTGIGHASKYFSNPLDHRIMLLDRVYFNNDSYKILETGKRDLDIIIEYLTQYPQLKISLTGHTDSKASEAYNYTLSINRAKAVQQYLIKNLIDSTRISIDGKGELEPLKPNTTKEGRAINRRVELRKVK